MISEQGSPPTDALDEQAITWVVRLTSGECNNALLAELGAWRRRSPAHEAALGRARDLWVGLGAALPAQLDIAPAAPRRRRRPALLAAVASLLLAVLIGLLAGVPGHDQSTGYGERRLVQLQDGTQVELNTASALDLDFDASRRHLTLARGEAYFDVAHDSARPFVIDAGFGRIQVLGTAFAVRHDQDQVQVTVARGKVRVEGGALRQPLYLTANQRLSLSASDSAPAVTQVDPEQALAWRSGQLPFEQRPLDEVLAELQRYDRRYWLYDAQAMHRYRLDTLVNLGDIDEWAAALPHTLPVSVTRLGPLVWLRPQDS